jgi:heat shock protein HtpX
MRIARRIFLFLLVNFLVITMISIVLSIFNVRPYIRQYGIDYTELMIFCLAWGMGGALISLALSRITAKWMMQVKTIDPNTQDAREKKLLQMIHSLAQKAQLPSMPEVGIYTSPEINAFATGPTKRRSLVAVSSGLLEKMDQDQVEGVLAHEVTHISNGDMVTMALLQGIVNAFVMFLARVLALVLSGFGKGDQKGGSYGSFIFFTFLFQTVFMILGSLVIFWFSRRREFRADAGGARLAGKEKMIYALQGLQKTLTHQPQVKAQPAIDTFKISTPSKPRSTLAQLFSSHPPLEVRIERLKTMTAV